MDNRRPTDHQLVRVAMIYVTFRAMANTGGKLCTLTFLRDVFDVDGATVIQPSPATLHGNGTRPLMKDIIKLRRARRAPFVKCHRQNYTSRRSRIVTVLAHIPLVL